MNDDNWSFRLETYGKDLSRKEMDLVRWINENPHKAAFLKLVELEKQSGVSRPVIISCYRHLGYSGYQLFRKGIQEFYSGQIDSYRASSVVFRDVHDFSDLVKAAVSVEQSAIQLLQSHFDYLSFEQIISFIMESPCTYVYGAGSGFYPSHYLVQRMHSLGLKALLVGTDHDHVMDDCMSSAPNDVFITFNYTQDIDTLLHVMHVFGEHKAKRVFISGSMSPILCQQADVCMFVPRGSIQFKNSMAVPMVFAQMLLLGLELAGGTKTAENLEELDKYERNLP